MEAQPDTIDHLSRAEFAYKANPHNTNVTIDYAHHLLAAGKTHCAIEIGELARSNNPNDFRTQRFVSSAYAVAGDLGPAIAAAECAVSLRPNDPEARLNVASLLIARQQPRPAIVHLMAISRLSQESGTSWRILSTALTELGRPDRALTAIGRAIEMEPRKVEYRVHRASVLISRHRYDEALEELALAAEITPDDAYVMRTRSGLLAAMGRDQEALTDAQRAVDLSPTNVEFRAHVAQLQMQAGLAVHDDTLTYGELERHAIEWTSESATSHRPHPMHPTGFFAALSISTRVIFALMTRDMRSRFGRSRLGYFWALMEPIGHLLTLGTIFAFLNHGRPLLGTDLYIFYVTGLVPFLIFSHVVVELMPALTANIPVLSLPIVKQWDVLVAKSILSLWTETLVAIIVFGGFVLLGRPGLPSDLLTCMAAILVIWLLAVGFGLINMVVAEMFHTWESVVSATLRLLYFLSGIYYSPIIMPAWLRDILVLNPVLQGVELFRSGFYRQYEPHWLNIPYLLVWTGGTLIIGLALQRVIGRRLVTFG